MASLENFRLAVFRTVAHQLSFRKAAEDLYLTQPAVSLQIKALEEDLGVLLFDRSGSRIALTAAGKTLLKYADQANALLVEAEQAVAALGGEHTGHLALGASTTIAQYVLPRLLSEFRREHPRTQLTLISGNTEHIVDALVQKRISLGLIEGPPRSRDVKTIPFLRDELVLIVPAAHDWAERSSVACSELVATPLLMRERGSGSRRVVEMALARHLLKPASLNITMELDSTEAIKSAVESGLGAGFASRWAIAKDARAGKSFKIVQIEGVTIERDFLVAHITGLEPQGLAKEFQRFLFSNTGARDGSKRSAGNKGPLDKQR